MTIALFSDIHANLPALHAFFNDVDTRQPDAVYCLGDLVGYHIYPNEVINTIRRRSIATIAGNHDAKVARLTEAQRTAASGKNYAYSLIGADERNYLATLPAHIRVEFQLNGDKLTRSHCSWSTAAPPATTNIYWKTKTKPNSCKSLQKANADILCFGHSHKPYYRILHSGTDDQPQFCTPSITGSVGKPKGRQPPWWLRPAAYQPQQQQHR